MPIPRWLGQLLFKLKFDPTDEEKKWATQEAAKLVKYGDEESIATILLVTRCTARQAFYRDGYAANDRAERLLAVLKSNAAKDQLRWRLCCGKNHCNAANHCMDHDISADGYAERIGCESKEITDEADTALTAIHDMLRDVAEQES